MANINILDSKIKKLRIELPHYSFNHSSSEVSPHAFVGRKKIQEKLRKLVEANDKTGVYLVTGNRGVGKTSLVNQVINQTSFQPNANFSQNFYYFLTLLFSVTITQFCLQKFEIINPSVLIFIEPKVFIPLIIFGVIFLISFFNTMVL